MQNTTLLFLVKKEGGTITDILLANKKRGFGMSKYNGVGGKVMIDEPIEEAAIRETKEEIGVEVQMLKNVAELRFEYLHKPQWNQIVHVYFCDSWDGQPSESEEVCPAWFTLQTLPYSQMWPDDAIWLPKVLAGQNIKGKFTFDGEEIISHYIESSPE